MGGLILMLCFRADGLLCVYLPIVASFARRMENLWLKLIKTTGLNWVIPRHCVSLMVERFLGDRLGKKASILWRCSVLAIFLGCLG